MSCRTHRNGRLDVSFLNQEGIMTTEEAFLQGDHKDVPMSLGCHGCIKQKPQMPFFVECYEVDGKKGLYWVKLPGSDRSKALLRVDKTKRQIQGAPIVKFQSRTGQLLGPYQFVLLEDRDMRLRLDLGPKIDDLKRSSPQTPATSSSGASLSAKYATRLAKRRRTSESTEYMDSQASPGTRSSSLSTPPETPDQNAGSQSDERQAAMQSRRATPHRGTRLYSHGDRRVSAEPKTSIELAGATPRSEIASSQHRNDPEEQYRGQSVNADATRLHTAMVESLQGESDESDPEAEDLLKQIADQRAINARKEQQLRANAELIRTRKLERKQRLEMQLTALKTQEVELDKVLAQTQADLMKSNQRLFTRDG